MPAAGKARRRVGVLASAITTGMQSLLLNFADVLCSDE
jgi:hypothetical protein